MIGDLNLKMEPKYRKLPIFYYKYKLSNPKPLNPKTLKPRRLFRPRLSMGFFRDVVLGSSQGFGLFRFFTLQN